LKLGPVRWYAIVHAERRRRSVASQSAPRFQGRESGGSRRRPSEGDAGTGFTDPTCWPGLYGGSYLKQLLGASQDPILGECWLWIAQYGPTVRVPPAWKLWTMWQYTDGAVGPGPHELAGIGRCDRDRFNGDLAGLKRLWSV
jgi:hypothetical protein